jgi:cytochrome b561
MMNRHGKYTNVSRQGDDRFQRSAKTISIALYLFFAALLVCGILIITR